MSQLKQLKKRIISIEETRKLTAAMMLVAGARLRKTEQIDKQARDYITSFERIHHVFPSLFIGDLSQIPFFRSPPPRATHLVIILTSHRGLCGSFNATIVRAAQNFIKKLLSQNENVFLLPIGQKGYTLLQKKWQSHFMEEAPSLEGEISLFHKAQRLSDWVISLFHEKIIHKCTLFLSQFCSIIEQIPAQETILPVPIPLPNPEASLSPHALYEFEPKSDDFIDSFCPSFVCSRLYNGLLQTALSESGARMASMDAATRNAEDLLSDLRLRYNRQRQSAITNELIEIIAGAESLKTT